MSLRYPLLRAQVPVPSYIHAWILGHPRLGNALYNLVRPAALCSARLGNSVSFSHVEGTCGEQRPCEALQGSTVLKPYDLWQSR